MTTCQACLALIVLNTPTGEPRATVSMTAMELVEAASAVSTPDLARRILVGLALLDENAARTAAEDRAAAGVDTQGEVLTADTITDNQILELRAQGGIDRDCARHALAPYHVDTGMKQAARAFCSKILNARHNAAAAAAASHTPGAALAARAQRDVRSIASRIVNKLLATREELADLKKTHNGSVSLRCLTLNDQCDLLEDILDVPHTHPRATQEDR